MLPQTLNTTRIYKTVAIAVVFVAAVFVFTGFFAAPAYAQDVPAEDLFGTEDLDQNLQLSGIDIRVVIAKIIRAVLGLLGIMALSIILYAGFTIMTSGGNEQKVEAGKKILVNGVIGLAIVLSSFAIVQFVISSLDRAIRQGGGGLDQAQRVRLDAFQGSAGLGRIIVDHYPFRGQTSVPRNARIVITFAEAIDPTTLIFDHNGNGTIGDCEEDDVFSWEDDCDHLKQQAFKIFESTDEPIASLLAEDMVASAALANYDNEGNVRSFTIRPFDNIGSAEEEVWYTVYVTNDVELAAPGEGGDSAGADASVSVILKGVGDKKIQVLKAVREITGLSREDFAEKLSTSARIVTAAMMQHWEEGKQIIPLDTFNKAKRIALNKKIGARFLRRHREYLGKTQEELAEMLDPENPHMRSSIANWETGVACVPEDILLKVKRLAREDAGVRFAGLRGLCETTQTE